jgi:hypothetical protein
MPQMKKTSEATALLHSSNMKSYKKKHLNQNNKTIIYQSIPNYSASQSAGHQNNKQQVRFATRIKNRKFSRWFSR